MMKGVDSCADTLALPRVFGRMPNTAGRMPTPPIRFDSGRCLDGALVFESHFTEGTVREMRQKSRRKRQSERNSAISSAGSAVDPALRRSPCGAFAPLKSISLRVSAFRSSCEHLCVKMCQFFFHRAQEL
jgi:uncharacterized protein with GYD domain